MNKSVLVITFKADLHADAVITTLQQKGISAIRLNTEDFRKNKILLTKSSNNPLFQDKWFISTPEGRVISTNTISSVYVRRIAPIDVEEVCDIYQRFSQDEVTVFLESLTTLLSDIPWYDNPETQTKASNKVSQLTHAIKCGLDIPPTCVTNEVQEVVAFIKQQKRVVYKTLLRPVIDFSNKGRAIINTTLITKEHLNLLRSVVVTPCLFQKEIDKKFELRIHVIGKKVIPIKINSQEHSDALIDWRKAPFCELSYENFTLPIEIEFRLLRLMETLGLHIGIIDMIVSKTNDYIFLEVNPTGNWLWLESRVEAPICRFIADLIASQPQTTS